MSVFGGHVQVPRDVHEAQEVADPANVVVYEPGDVVLTVTAEDAEGNRVIHGFRVGDDGGLVELSPLELSAHATGQPLEGLEPEEPAQGPTGPRLSVRERQILLLVEQGRTGMQIAEELGVATNTVAQHLVSVRRKYRVKSSLAAAAAARRDGTLES